MRIGRSRLLAAILLVAAPAAASAAPLDAPACTALKTEYDGLISGGAKADMDRGPAWAKTNLSPDKLQKIERLIALQEQLSFRCGEFLTARPLLKEPPKPPQEAGAEGKDGKDGKDGKKATAKAAADSLDGATPSNIPPPKRKNKDAASAAGKTSSRN